LSSGLIPLHSTSFPIILGCDNVKSVMWKFCVKTILNFKYGKSWFGLKLSKWSFAYEYLHNIARSCMFTAVVMAWLINCYALVSINTVALHWIFI